MIKRSYAILSLLVLASMVLAACNPGEAPAASTATVAPTQAETQIPSTPIITSTPLFTSTPLAPTNTSTVTPYPNLWGRINMTSTLFLVDDKDQGYIVSMTEAKKKFGTEGAVSTKIRNGETFTYTAPTGIKGIAYESAKDGQVYVWKGMPGIRQAVLTQNDPPGISVCTKTTDCEGNWVNLKIDGKASPQLLSKHRDIFEETTLGFWDTWMPMGEANEVCYMPYSQFSIPAWCPPASATPIVTETITPRPTVTMISTLDLVKITLPAKNLSYNNLALSDNAFLGITEKGKVWAISIEKARYGFPNLSDPYRFFLWFDKDDLDFQFTEVPPGGDSFTFTGTAIIPQDTKITYRGVNVKSWVKSIPYSNKYLAATIVELTNWFQSNQLCFEPGETEYSLASKCREE